MKYILTDEMFSESKDSAESIIPISKLEIIPNLKEKKVSNNMISLRKESKCGMRGLYHVAFPKHKTNLLYEFADSELLEGIKAFIYDHSLPKITQIHVQTVMMDIGRLQYAKLKEEEMRELMRSSPFLLYGSVFIYIGFEECFPKLKEIEENDLPKFFYQLFVDFLQKKGIKIDKIFMKMDSTNIFSDESLIEIPEITLQFNPNEYSLDYSLFKMDMLDRFGWKIEGNLSVNDIDQAFEINYLHPKQAKMIIDNINNPSIKIQNQTNGEYLSFTQFEDLYEIFKDDEISSIIIYNPLQTQYSDESEEDLDTLTHTHVKDEDDF